jgi:hypothetical protein
VSEKMTILDVFDMHFVVLDIYFVNMFEYIYYIYTPFWVAPVLKSRLVIHSILQEALESQGSLSKLTTSFHGPRMQ